MAIQKLKVPTTVKEVRSIIGLIQYYRDVWRNRSDVLDPLTELIKTNGTKKNSNKRVKWTGVHQAAFENIKEISAREVLLVYPRSPLRPAYRTGKSPDFGPASPYSVLM